jgi:hypothetical protein
MNALRFLLLGTATALFPGASAEADDVPMKVSSEQYVKVCGGSFGDGFYYIPGTNTCLKMGGYWRAQTEYNMGAGGVAIGTNPTESPQARFTRDNTNDINYRVRGLIVWDIRQRTEYGTLRTYIRLGVDNTAPAQTGGGTTPNPFWNRAFLEFAGFTVGRARSFFDLFTYFGGQNYTYGHLEK